MAVCEACGAKVGLFGRKKVKLYSEVICEDCLKSWGYTQADLLNERYKYKSFRFLSRGKAEVDAIIDRDEYEKEHTKTRRFYMELDENEDGKDLQKIAPKIMKMYADEPYGGFTNKDLKDSGYYDEKYFQYDANALDCELRIEGDTVKVYCEGYHIGDVPEALPILEAHPEAEHDIMFLGGKYKCLIYDDYADKDVVETGEISYYAYMQLQWIE